MICERYISIYEHSIKDEDDRIEKILLNASKIFPDLRHYQLTFPVMSLSHKYVRKSKKCPQAHHNKISGKLYMN